MANTASQDRFDPITAPAPASQASEDLREAVEPAPGRYDSDLPASTSARSALDQLSRIEDKAARIEEKYARTEALMMRVTDKLDSATGRMNEAARQADLDALRQDVAAFSRRVRSLPGMGALFLTAIVTALLAAGITVALLKYGLPGVLPQ